jgi:putative exporter of polyketide antibiotics
MKKFKVKRIKRDISNKSTNKQTRKNSAEKIITGFFGLFWTLGQTPLFGNIISSCLLVFGAI